MVKGNNPTLDAQKLSELKSENLYDACYCMNSNEDRDWIAKTRYGHLHYLSTLFFIRGLPPKNETIQRNKFDNVIQKLYPQAEL